MSDRYEGAHRKMTGESVDTYEGSHDVHSSMLGRAQTGLPAFM
jgi:hypothetical protein